MNRMVVVGFFVIALAAGVLGWMSSKRGTAPEKEFRRLILTGSSTVAPLAAEIGKRFEALHPQVREIGRASCRERV